MKVASILSDPQLSSTLFRALEASAEQGGEAAGGRRAEGGQAACVDGSAEQASRLAGQAKVLRALSQLPASQRSLLDEATLAFLGQLWRALKADEPLTAAALLEPPPPPDPPPLPRTHLSQPALCDLFNPENLDRHHPLAALATGDAARPGCVWELGAVRRWVEGRVLALQGFSDQIVVDAICRRLESHPHAQRGGTSAASAPVGPSRGAACSSSSPRAADSKGASAAAAAAAELDIVSLTAH